MWFSGLRQVAGDVFLDIGSGTGKAVVAAALLYPALRLAVGWPKRCELPRACLWEHSDKKLKLTQLLGQLGVFGTLGFD
jgi:hypothetical protein